MAITIQELLAKSRIPEAEWNKRAWLRDFLLEQKEAY